MEKCKKELLTVSYLFFPPFIYYSESFMTATEMGSAWNIKHE